MRILRSLLRRFGHAGFLRFGLRDRILRTCHDPDSARGERFEVDFYGLVYEGDFASFIDWSVYYYGAYSGEELQLMADCLSLLDRPVLLDIGANVGHHTLFGSRFADRVHSFEPFHEVAATLRERVSRNSLQRVVEVHEVALGEVNEPRAYHPPDDCNRGTGSFVAVRTTRAPLSLKVRRGDDYLPEHGITRADFIKIDVEGYEVHVLRGLRGTLEAQRPICFVEWTQGQQGGHKMDPTRLFPPGYRFLSFVSETRFLWLFSRGHYRLNALPSRCPDGMILAVPEEFVDRVSAIRPVPKAALRIQGR